MQEFCNYTQPDVDGSNVWWHREDMTGHHRLGTKKYLYVADQRENLYFYITQQDAKLHFKLGLGIDKDESQDRYLFQTINLD